VQLREMSLVQLKATLKETSLVCLLDLLTAMPMALMMESGLEHLTETLKDSLLDDLMVTLMVLMMETNSVYMTAHQ